MDSSDGRTSELLWIMSGGPGVLLATALTVSLFLSSFLSFSLSLSYAPDGFAFVVGM